MAAAHPEVDRPGEPTPVARPDRLADIVRTQAAARPHAPALTFGDRTWSYADLDRRSSRVANALVGAGVEPGDRVAILSRNHPAFFELAFGVSKANATMLGVNWRLAPPEIEAILGDARPKVLVVGDDLAGLLTERARAGVELVLGEADYEAFLRTAPTTDPAVDSGPDDVVFLLYTSGTTGVPKGVQLTNGNMSHSAWISQLAYGVTDATVNLVAMPLFHVGGIGYGLSAFFHGGHTVLLRDADPALIVRTLETHRITHAFFVPAVIQSLLAVPGVEEADLSSLELLVYGASPIGDAVLRRAIAVLGCDFTQAYGMTETAGSIVALAPADHDPDGPHAGRLRSCGRALPWVEVRLVDPRTGLDVPTGEVGEIWTRSAQNTIGYRGKPEETAETITADGWLRTGDAAYQDEDGYLFLFDRFKDMIVSGAENVYPAEVENVLYDHPGVAEVAVIGVPHERWGETVKAIVVAREPLDADELIAFTRTRLARYKCPTSVEFTEALPRNASGKVLKKELRAPYWQGAERSIQ
jgi:acyl-CoA synthetase (AMP-forming)/AMP-acid ligase II